MEISRRFMKFLQELKDPHVQEKYLNPELQENLQTIAQMIHELDLVKSPGLPSLNDVLLFETGLLDGCLQITKKLKNNIDSISLLHTYVTNFALHSSNVYNFLKLYCQAIFECASLSILAFKPNSPGFMRIVDGNEVGHEEHLEIVTDLRELMKGKLFVALDTSPISVLQPYLASKHYIGNVVVQLKDKDSQIPLYFILHFTKDSPFTGSYIRGDYYKEYPLICPLVQECLEAIENGIYYQKKNLILEKLETIKLTLTEVHKNYFLSYIASEIQTSLECEVATSVVFGQEEAKVPIKSNKKSMQMVVSDNHSLELKNNFEWDNTKLNHKLSRLWEKFHKTLKFLEQRTFYHFYIKRTNDLFLEFSEDCNLVYQSQPLLSEDHRALIDIQDFLTDLRGRSLDQIFGKTETLLKIFQSYIQETRYSKSPLFIKSGQYGEVQYEFIGRRKEGKDKLEVFSIILKEAKGMKSFPGRHSEGLMRDLKNSNDSSPKVMKLSRTKKGLSARNLGARAVLGEDVDIKALKQTIVSEYLPDELTNIDDVGKPHQSISSVNKIKINLTSKTAFIDSPVPNTPHFKPMEQITFLGIAKPVVFSSETLVVQKTDHHVFENWSFDAVNIQEPIEKCRLVWAMLNEFGLIKEFNIDLNVLCEFINRIKGKYNSSNNSFHNFDHGITGVYIKIVMHGSFYILRHIPNKFTNLVNLGVLVSAFCHDVGHTGRNNQFEVNSLSRLALKYHDKSVLEQHHAAVTFKILNKETSNIFSTIEGEDFKQLRKLIISNILSTDMKVHFDVMTSFKDVRDRIEKSGEENFVWKDEDVKTVTGMIIHCSDVCGPTKIFEVAKNWALRVNQEFTIQVREEEALEIPVTPYFKDLDQPEVMAKQEIAFISFMIKPLWETFDKFFGGSMKKAVDNIENNIQEWNKLREIAIKQKEESKENETEIKLE